jgi:H+/Cl- antiporter ClcA
MKLTTPGALPTAAGNIIPSTLQSPDAVRFWLTVLFTGVGMGIGAAALTRLLEVAQHVAWSGSATNILDAAQRATPLQHIVVLFTAAALTGIGQLLLKHLSSGNGIDTTAVIWFHSGRMPALRTMGSAALSVIIVCLGVSLGREGAPKQAGDLGRSAPAYGLGTNHGTDLVIGALGIVSIWFPQILGRNGKTFRNSPSRAS